MILVLISPIPNKYVCPAVDVRVHQRLIRILHYEAILFDDVLGYGEILGELAIGSKTISEVLAA